MYFVFYQKNIIIIIIIIIIILFILRCWTQASIPEPLKQDTQKGKDNRKENKLILNTL